MAARIVITIQGDGDGQTSVEVSARKVSQLDILETMVAALTSILYADQTPVFVREAVLETLPDIIRKFGTHQDAMMLQGKEAQFLAALNDLGPIQAPTQDKEDK